ncbi:PqqD family protein [Deinococcus radiomollis]|uniref:PqqD family protein n=1 Tax=Deinococcus radiomollis TaxID=468916 RepID=UPI0038924DB4
MPDQRYAPHPEVLVTDLNDELVLLHSATSQMYSLNTVARSVWQGLPATPAELLARILEQYEVEPEQAGHDLDALLADLQRLDMVQPA